jgi:hypothetical protein
VLIKFDIDRSSQSSSFYVVFLLHGNGGVWKLSERTWRKKQLIHQQKKKDQEQDAPFLKHRNRDLYLEIFPFLQSFYCSLLILIPWSACLDNLYFTFPIAIYVKACEKGKWLVTVLCSTYLHYFAGRALSKQALARTESFCCCFDQFIYLLFSLIKFLFKVDLYSKPGRNGWLSATSVDHSIKWIEWCKRLYHNLLSHLEEWITWEYQISGLKDWAGAIDQLPLYEGKWSNWAASLLTVA